MYMRYVKRMRQFRSSFYQCRGDSKTAGDRTQRARIELCRLVRANRETAPPRIVGFASLLSIEPRQPTLFSIARIIDSRTPKVPKKYYLKA